jgi:Tfp pilus assembly protein PilV
MEPLLNRLMHQKVGSKKPHSTPCSQVEQGASLLEVLVAIMVLSVGLLGLTALHWRTVQQSHAVIGKTLATLHAQDAAERLWLHPCWNVTQAETALHHWAQRPPPTLPDWHATWQWHSNHTGWARLHITQHWARQPQPFTLTFTAPASPCHSTP